MRTMKQTGGMFNMAAEFGPSGRRLVLVDIENYLGRRYVTRAAAVWAAAHLREVLAIRDGELVVVGTSHTSNLLAASNAWEHVRHVARLGQDGADMALIDVLSDGIAHRFTEIVLVSGDGIFADHLATLASQGMTTTVVARSGALSARLRFAAHRVVCPQVDFLGPITDALVA